MGLLDKLKNSLLGLGGVKPSSFGVDPTPPASLHNSYSVDGKPDVTWKSINSVGMKPVPSHLDELDPQAPKLIPGGVVSKDYKSKPGRKYLDNKPK